MKLVATRKIDPLGRIVLPHGLRAGHDLPEGAAMDIFDDENGGILLRRHAAPAGPDAAEP